MNLGLKLSYYQRLHGNYIVIAEVKIWHFWDWSSQVKLRISCNKRNQLTLLLYRFPNFAVLVQLTSFYSILHCVKITEEVC